MQTPTPEDINEFVNLGAKLSSKAICALLKETVKWSSTNGPGWINRTPTCHDQAAANAARRAADPNYKSLDIAIRDTPESEARRRVAEAEALCAEIDKATLFPVPGYTSVEMEETKWSLNISLVLVPADYKTVIDVPSHDYINDIFARYDFSKQVAKAYWSTFHEKNGDLIKRIEKHCGRELGPLEEVVPDGAEAGTTLCWFTEVPYRVGVFCYYVDENGRPMIKKSSVSTSAPAPPPTDK